MLKANGLMMDDVDYPPDLRMAPHAHDVTTVSLVLRGAVEEEVGRDERREGVSALVVKPAGTVHRNRFGPAGARLVTVAVPHACEARLGERLPMLRRWRWLEGGPAARVLWKLAATARRSPARAAEVLEDALFELLDALDDGSNDGARDAPHWLRRVRERLHDEYAAAPRVAELARSVGVHPVSLTRAFRAAYGVPVTEYARRLRVHAAAERLASSDTPLAQVAFGAGFADQAHLCRVLKAETGLTPRGLREVAAGAPV